MKCRSFHPLVPDLILGDPVATCFLGHQKLKVREILSMRSGNSQSGYEVKCEGLPWLDANWFVKVENENHD